MIRYFFKLKNIFIISLANIFMLACNQNTPANQTFERLLNLPFPALMDSLDIAQNRLQSIYGDENAPDSVYYHFYSYYDDLIAFAKKKSTKKER